jgi:hypothetical protein
MSLYSHKEQFLYDENDIDLTVNNPSKWTYCDLLGNTQRAMLAEYIVASSLHRAESSTKLTNRPFELLATISNKPMRIGIRYASYLQSAEAEHPDHISFNMNAESGCDLYIFCLYKALTREANPLNLNLWDFFVATASDISNRNQKLTLSSLMKIASMSCTHNGLYKAINNICNSTRQVTQ